MSDSLADSVRPDAVFKRPGKVWLVGAGPGATDLLTLRAARLLAQADVVFYDALVNPETVALAVRAEKVAVGKRCGKHSAAQKFINKRLVDAARNHALVVRLKGGDPMMFGRAHEEIEALIDAGIQFEVIPGVTAALAASAELGISLSRRALSRSVTFATPRVGVDEASSDWALSVLAADTAVLYMSVGHAGAIAKELIERGKPSGTPVAVVRDASSPAAEVMFTTLAGLQKGLPADGRPAVLCIGEVYREALAAARAEAGASSSDQAAGQFVSAQPNIAAWRCR